MRIGVDIKRAEVIQLIQVVDIQQNEKLEKCLHALLISADHWEWDNKILFSTLKEEMLKPDSQLSTIP